MKSLILYEELVSEVERFLGAATDTFRSGMVCGPGCDECCRQRLSLLPVEAYRLRQGFERLSSEAQRRVLDASRTLVGVGGDGPCPLLHEGICALYDHRPLVCRTHGFPLYSEAFREMKGVSVDFCHLNFTEGDGTTVIPRNAILNLDILHRKLFHLNQLFLGEMHTPRGGQKDRVDIAELFAGYEF